MSEKPRQHKRESGTRLQWESSSAVWARAMKGSRRWVTQNSGELAGRSRCLEFCPNSAGSPPNRAWTERPNSTKGRIWPCWVPSKQHREFKEFVRYSRGKYLVGNSIYSCASLDVCISVQQILTHPTSRGYLLIPLMMGFFLNLLWSMEC